VQTLLQFAGAAAWFFTAYAPVCAGKIHLNQFW
jgi:hypothetical protein